MPDPAGTKNDGGLVFGSQVVTIDSVAYVAENISIDAPSTIIEQKDEYGVPSGQVIVEGFVTGTATLQLASSTTALPQIGDAFTLTQVGGGSAVYFLISQVGQSFSQDAETKVNVSFRKRINTPAP
jgi:hypothetical protein